MTMPSNSHLRQIVAASTLATVAMILATPQQSLAVIRSVTFSDSFPGSGGTAVTNFADTLEVSRFDPNLGLLTGISFTLDGLVEGIAQVENTSASSATITTDLAAQLTVTSDDLADASGGTLGQLVQSTPIASDTRTVAAFDSAIDFGGASGFTLDSLSNTSSTTFTVTSGEPDFLLFQDVFTGTAGNPGSIVLDLIGEGTSHVSGPGNIVTSLQTSAGASFDITYTYNGIDFLESPLPSPPTSVPFEFSPALGLFLVGGFFGTSYVVKKSKSQKLD